VSFVVEPVPVKNTRYAAQPILTRLIAAFIEQHTWTATITGSFQKKAPPQRGCGRIIADSFPWWEATSNVTFYKIRITDGRMKWLIERRYSDFSDFHRALAEAADFESGTEVLPELPDKWESCRLLNHHELVASRNLQLQDYVRRLCRICNQRTTATERQRELTLSFLRADSFEAGSMLLDTPPLSPTNQLDGLESSFNGGEGKRRVVGKDGSLEDSELLDGRL